MYGQSNQWNSFLKNHTIRKRKKKKGSLLRIYNKTAERHPQKIKNKKMIIKNWKDSWEWFQFIFITVFFAVAKCKTDSKHWSLFRTVLLLWLLEGIAEKWLPMASMYSLWERLLSTKLSLELSSYFVWGKNSSSLLFPSSHFCTECEKPSVLLTIFSYQY